MAKAVMLDSDPQRCRNCFRKIPFLRYSNSASAFWNRKRDAIDTSNPSRRANRIRNAKL